MFSNKKLVIEEDTCKDGMKIADFDTPYIKKVEPLKEYLKEDSELKFIDIQLLFDFITEMNVLNSLGAFNDEDNKED